MIKVGDTVTYSQAWLQIATRGNPCNHLWRAVGKVIEVLPHKMAVVSWDDPECHQYVRVENLAHPGTDKACRIDAKGWVGHGAIGEKKCKTFK